MLFAGVTASEISRICITHFHGDHCLGVPGVLARLSLDRVRHAVEVCYPAESQEVFWRLRHASLFRDVLDLREQPVCGDGQVAVTSLFGLEARELSHSVPTVGYRLVEPDGRRMLPDRLAAFGVTGPDIGRLQREGRLSVDGRMVTMDQVSELKRGQRFAFIMDTRLCDAAFVLADQADMLVCECTFAETEAGLARDYGHLTARQAGRIAAEASRCGCCIPTHFSERYETAGAERLAAEAASAFGGGVVLAHDFGWWPGDARYGEAAFYSYAHPAPSGFARMTLFPAGRALGCCPGGVHPELGGRPHRRRSARDRPGVHALGVPPCLHRLRLGHRTRRQRRGNSAAGGVNSAVSHRELVVLGCSFSRISRSVTKPPEPGRLAAEAASAFGGEVVLAEDLDRISVPFRRPSPLPGVRRPE